MREIEGSILSRQEVCYSQRHREREREGGGTQKRVVNENVIEKGKRKRKRQRERGGEVAGKKGSHRKCMEMETESRFGW